MYIEYTAHPRWAKGEKRTYSLGRKPAKMPEMPEVGTEGGPESRFLIAIRRDRGTSILGAEKKAKRSMEAGPLKVDLTVSGRGDAPGHLADALIATIHAAVEKAMADLKMTGVKTGQGPDPSPPLRRMTDAELDEFNARLQGNRPPLSFTDKPADPADYLPPPGADERGRDQ